MDFMSGCDGKPWVWVMGEHKADKSVEEIIEAEQESRASKMAEEEAELLRYTHTHTHMHMQSRMHAHSSSLG